MVRVLVIGYAPEAVDFSDPAVPSGLNAERVAAGIEADLQKMRARGWQAEHLSLGLDEDIRAHVLEQLRGRSYDCIVIGAGVRMTTKHVRACEEVVNAVRQGAPETPIAFNAGPDSSGEAANRWLSEAHA